jgi:hypothetical protein
MITCILIGFVVERRVSTQLFSLLVYFLLAALLVCFAFKITSGKATQPQGKIRSLKRAFD